MNILFYTLLPLIVVGVIVYFLIKRSKFKSLAPHMPAQYNFGKRRDTFLKSIQLMESRGAKVLVETGTARKGLERTKSDGASTIVFGHWAKKNNAEFHSVDIDPEAINEVSTSVDTDELGQHVHLHVMDSVLFLENFSQPIDFLYLDSYDYHKHDLEIQRQSKEHHLKEFKAVESKLHENTVVLIDDCRLPNGGKGKLVIDYMLENGWEKVMDEYQVLLVKSN